NATVQSHNQKTKDFQQLKMAAADKVKNHYLSCIFDDVKALDTEIEAIAKDLERRAAEIAEIQARIAANRAQISSDHKACADINAGLNIFLGRSELQFVPDVEKETDADGNEKETIHGYSIMRGDKPAVYLSEGEKTAIAFVYFVVHLKDGEFTPEEGIVVVDDPISSLDANSLYQAFSFLKNAVKDCGQVFIMTHNFDFLKLLLNWRKGADRAKSKETGFYMISNEFVDDKRKAVLDVLDELLLKYESEYHFLFKLLKEMRDSQDGSLLRAYPVPNIARKVWDTFLMFRVPDGNGTYVKMEYLKSKQYDAQILDAIYKFTNDQSHITGAGFDPALVPETQKVVVELLAMIETLDPEHFRIINEATA
ncbi:AAA family ATPase, partial [Candidatus Kaiserbacteria bacterium]|nr:AAA family ATPase [Candidatus Kaiserbacteria bacterium]